MNDDFNLFCSHCSLQHLVCNHLYNVNEWLCGNKLSLNIEKSNFVVFYPPQKKPQYSMNLKINNKTLQEKSSTKYLGIIIDHYLNWKEHVSQLSKKESRGIGILSKLRHFVPIKILIQIYYSIIYPFLLYGLIIWGNTYNSNILPLVTLKKKVVIMFSDF